MTDHTARLILDLRPANERCRYFVTTSLIGWVQAWNVPCTVLTMFCYPNQPKYDTFKEYTFRYKVPCHKSFPMVVFILIHKDSHVYAKFLFSHFSLNQCFYQTLIFQFDYADENQIKTTALEMR